MREMNNPIKFSVTVPAYKAQFLKECIDSILAQTYQNFELIIVNDASPQDLDSIVAQYHDPRIRYYKNKVGFGAEHVVGNWNKCLEYATGDYLICMGDDDKLLPNCLEEYVKLMGQYPDLDLYHTMTEIVDEKDNITGIQEPRPLWESVYSIIYWRWKSRHQQYIGDWLFKIKTLRKEGGFYDLPYAWGSDDLSAAVAAIDKGVANTQQPGFQYRKSGQTISSDNSNAIQKIESIRRIYDFYANFLKKVPEERLDKLYYKLLKESFQNERLKALAWNIGADLKNHPQHILTMWLHGKVDHKTLLRSVIYTLR
jgi:glycosyltransferase involved in cell wall biosynthesis